MYARWRRRYLLYVTRNGQHLWEGPFTSQRRAKSRLKMLLDANDPVIISPGVTISWPPK
jgi:hypothetical protein